MSQKLRETLLPLLGRSLPRAVNCVSAKFPIAQRMAALEAEKVETRLDQLGAAPPVRLHPNLSAVYTEKVARLADALNAPETKAEAGEIIRSPIERIVLTPEGERLRAELYGDLAGILALCGGEAFVR